VRYNMINICINTLVFIHRWKPRKVSFAYMCCEYKMSVFLQPLINVYSLFKRFMFSIFAEVRLKKEKGPFPPPIPL
jgi:hypothetical protein